MNRHPVVFFDKDGTLVSDLPFNTDPSRVLLMSGAVQALGRLHALGYSLVVISNQPGPALGYCSIRNVEKMGEHLRTLFLAHGIPLSGFYYCPHHPQGSVLQYSARCFCRKPEPGLILRAASDLGIDPMKSWFVGDILDDIEAGHRAGCRAILVDHGSETEWRSSPLRIPDRIVRNLEEAAEAIVESDRGTGFFTFPDCGQDQVSGGSSEDQP